MTYLNRYFSDPYVVRLANLKRAIMARRPEPDTASEDDIKEYAGWVQKELDFFYIGTHNQLKPHCGLLENLTDPRHKLLVSVEFINNYLLGEVTDQQIKDMFK